MPVAKHRPIIRMNSPLDSIPRQWLKDIEPKIKREIHHGDLCWLWQGAIDGQGHPVMFFPGLNGKRTSRRVARYVAGMFWRLQSHHKVIHRCNVLNCVNPNHFVVTDVHWTRR